MICGVLEKLEMIGCTWAIICPKTAGRWVYSTAATTMTTSNPNSGPRQPQPQPQPRRLRGAGPGADARIGSYTVVGCCSTMMISGARVGGGAAGGGIVGAWVRNSCGTTTVAPQYLHWTSTCPGSAVSDAPHSGQLKTIGDGMEPSSNATIHHNHGEKPKSCVEK